MQWLRFRLHKDKDYMNDIKLLTKPPWHMTVTTNDILLFWLQLNDAVFSIQFCLMVTKCN